MTDPGEDEGGERDSFFDCIIHHESLCGKALKMEYVMCTIPQAVNFIRDNGLNHRQFKSFLDELSS